MLVSRPLVLPLAPSTLHLYASQATDLLLPYRAVGNHLTCPSLGLGADYKAAHACSHTPSSGRVHCLRPLPRQFVI